MHHPHVGRIFAFEVDGYGSFYAIDDANIPSVLSLPYLGFIKAKDETYDRTRKFLFSDKNPFYFKGTKGRGIGSQHTGIVRNHDSIAAILIILIRTIFGPCPLSCKQLPARTTRRLKVRLKEPKICSRN